MKTNTYFWSYLGTLHEDQYVFWSYLGTLHEDQYVFWSYLGSLHEDQYVFLVISGYFTWRPIRILVISGYFTWRPIGILVISRWIRLRMRNVSDKCCSYKHAVIICNTFCSSTAAVVARTRFSATCIHVLHVLLNFASNSQRHIKKVACIDPLKVSNYCMFPTLRNCSFSPYLCRMILTVHGADHSLIRH